ncbi:MAG: hypothetical protein IH840_10675 [Candidatus Heimdallarchaeota archaeon]|nr:hypothetical protein [Candidatus Heimdallarchaeota archaeon]
MDSFKKWTKTNKLAVSGRKGQKRLSESALGKQAKIIQDYMRKTRRTIHKGVTETVNFTIDSVTSGIIILNENAFELFKQTAKFIEKRIDPLKLANNQR